MVFSVRAQDRNAYQELFRLRQIQKTYEAIAGVPASSPLKPEFPLTYKSMMVEDAQFFRMRELPVAECVLPDSFNSETWIDCIERLDPGNSSTRTDSSPTPGWARYELKPLTGQRHQLRVHMNSLGLPLINDQFYPKVLLHANDLGEFSAPLQLLAQTIAFKDPVTGSSRSFESLRQLNL